MRWIIPKLYLELRMNVELSVTPSAGGKNNPKSSNLAKDKTLPLKAADKLKKIKACALSGTWNTSHSRYFYFLHLSFLDRSSFRNTDATFFLRLQNC